MNATEKRRNASARAKLCPVESGALKRFEENLYPKPKDKKAKRELYPCAIIDRLDRAGLPASLVKSFLWAYATGADKPWADRRERGRIELELLRSKAHDAPLKEKLACLRGLGPEFHVRVPVAPGVMLAAFGYSEPGQEKQEAERRIELTKGLYANRRFGVRGRSSGVARLEYLVELQECAAHVKSPITPGELSALVSAALTAVDPLAKEIGTDSLARNLNRFCRRNADFVELTRELIPAWLKKGKGQ